jgi:hypothetical protein
MAEGLRNRLIAAWRLAEFSVIARDESLTHPMGEDLDGLIIYSPDGYMSGQLMKLGRPAYASGDMEHGTTEELPLRLPGTWPIPVRSMSMRRPRL